MNTKSAQRVVSPVNVADRQQVDVRAGDTVRVWQKVKEAGGKTRLQPFEGLVIARKHGSEAGATFTVRRTNDSYGTEKIFPLYSPAIDKLEIVKRATTRQSKLYHIREKAAKEIKRQMRNLRFVDIATVSDIEEKTKAESAQDSGEQEQRNVNDKKQDSGDGVKTDDASSAVEKKEVDTSEDFESKKAEEEKV